MVENWNWCQCSRSVFLFTLLRSTCWEQVSKTKMNEFDIRMNEMIKRKLKFSWNQRCWLILTRLSSPTYVKIKPTIIFHWSNEWIGTMRYLLRLLLFFMTNVALPPDGRKWIFYEEKCLCSWFPELFETDLVDETKDASETKNQPIMCVFQVLNDSMPMTN